MSTYLETKIKDINWHIEYHTQKLNEFKHELEFANKMVALEGSNMQQMEVTQND